MHGVALYEMNVAVQTCARVPAALLWFVLQKNINIHGVGGDEVGEDVTIESVVSVGPIDHLFAVDIDVGMTHGTIEDEGVELVLIDFDARAVVAFAHPRESTAAPGFPGCLVLAVLYDDDFLKVVLPIKRSADCPIVGDGHFAPNGIDLRHLNRRLPAKLPGGQEGANR